MSPHVFRSLSRYCFGTAASCLATALAFCLSDKLSDSQAMPFLIASIPACVGTAVLLEQMAERGARSTNLGIGLTIVGVLQLWIAFYALYWAFYSVHPSFGTAWISGTVWLVITLCIMLYG